MSTDLERILEVHEGWYEANLGLVADRMLQYFPKGDGYHQFNLNGHTYHGVLDKHRLWVNAAKIGLSITAIKDTVGPDVQVFGDVALLTAEGTADVLSPGQENAVTTPFRTTEFFRRDNGEGGQDWRIWHMHVSVQDPQMPKHGTE